MARVLCWLAARLAGLSTVVAIDADRVLLLTARDGPAWGRRWARRLLFRAGHLSAGERVVGPEELGSAARARAAASTPRAEFLPGAFAAFRARALREAWDFSAIAAR